jgi:hypothetical protein
VCVCGGGVQSVCSQMRQHNSLHLQVLVYGAISTRAAFNVQSVAIAVQILQLLRRSTRH